MSKPFILVSDPNQRVVAGAEFTWIFVIQLSSILKMLDNKKTASVGDFSYS